MKTVFFSSTMTFRLSSGFDLERTVLFIVLSGPQFCNEMDTFEVCVAFTTCILLVQETLLPPLGGNPPKSYQTTASGSKSRILD